ncbi:hypothetical protein D3C72_1599820 [compost metagenome]
MVLRPAHGLGGGGAVQLLQYPQGESFALARRQFAQRLYQLRVLLALLVRLRRAGRGIGPVDVMVAAFLVAAAPEAQAEAASALQVDHAPAQDAPEQRRPLGGRLVLVGQHAQHGVLHRIQRIVALAQAGLGEAEGARADPGQERVQRHRQRGVGLVGQCLQGRAHQHRVALAQGGYGENAPAADRLTGPAERFSAWL